MKKVLKIIRNIIIGIVLVAYFSFIILVSTLLLNRNNYGITEIGGKALITINKEIANESYKVGELVILEVKEISELKVGQEIFVYQPNKKDRTIDIVIAEIEEIITDTNSPYVTLVNDGTAWGEDYIAGITYSKYDKVGSFINFIESKWIFFIFLILPCFFILLYEVYLLIIAIKFDDEEDDEEIIEEKVEAKEEPINLDNKEITNNSDQLSYIEQQILELKTKSVTETSEVVEDKNEKIEELMKQISELRKEYDDKNTFTQEIPVMTENPIINKEEIESIDEKQNEVQEKETVVEVTSKEQVVEKKNNKENPQVNKQKQNQNNKNNQNKNNQNNKKRNNNYKNNNYKHNRNNNNKNKQYNKNKKNNNK